MRLLQAWEPEQGWQMGMRSPKRVPHMQPIPPDENRARQQRGLRGITDFLFINIILFIILFFSNGYILVAYLKGQGGLGTT